jgi:hypothetical protein
MAEAGASKLDVLYISKTGGILHDLEWDSRYRNWKYRIEGPDKTGEWLTIIAAIDEMNQLIHFVTVF